MTFKQFLSISEDMAAMTQNPLATKTAADQKFQQAFQQTPVGMTAKRKVNTAIDTVAKKDPNAAQTLVNPEDQAQPGTPKMMRKMKK